MKKSNSTYKKNGFHSFQKVSFRNYYYAIIAGLILVLLLTIQLVYAANSGGNYARNPEPTSVLRKGPIDVMYTGSVGNSFNVILYSATGGVPKNSIFISAPVIFIKQPDCLQRTGMISISSPIGSEYSYSIDGVTYQKGEFFGGLVPGFYPVTAKDTNGVVSEVTMAQIKSPPSNCDADIFHTIEKCDDFRRGVDSPRLDQLCYTVKANKIFNVTPGEFYYYTFIVAPRSSFTITVNQSINIAGFPLFTTNKDQIVLWSDSCLKFTTGTEDTNGLIQVQVSGAQTGKTYILSIKYNSKSIIGNIVADSLSPQYSFSTYLDNLLVEKSTTSIYLYPNNCENQGSAILGNKVWNDQNADGIQDSGELGIANVKVRLYTCGGLLLDSTLTGISGVYNFTGLLPGSYYVDFEVPSGYRISLQDQGSNDSTDSDADTVSGHTSCVTLSAAESNTSLDAGMYQPTGIGDLVWNDLDNDGIQDAFEPGIVTTVKLYTCTGDLVATTISSEDGAYSFDHLLPGSYYLQFTLPENYFFSPKDEGSNDSIDSDVDGSTGKTNCFILFAGEINNTIDCGIDPPVSLGDFVWNDLNGNGVQDTSEPGMPESIVKLYDCNDSLISTTITDSSGYYLFEVIPPGSYYVEFGLPEGFVFSPFHQMGTDSTDSDADPVTGRSICQALIFGQKDTLKDAGMYFPVRIGNYVWKDLDGDGIQDSLEHGFANINIKLYTCGDSLIDSTTTDADGFYLFDELRPGSYYISIELPTGFIFSPRDEAGNDSTDSDIDTASHRSNCITLISGDLNLILDAGIVCVPPDSASISLTQPNCTDATGTITIIAPVGAGLVYSIDGVNYQDSVTFSGLTAGTYLVTVMNSDSCVSDAVSAVLDSQPPTPDTATLSVIQPSCTVATGTITVIAPVGAGLVYSIDGVNYQDSVTFSGLTAGTYLVTVMNSDSCISDAVSGVLDSQPPTPDTATLSVIQPSCTVATGTITVIAPVGAGLVYSIDGVNYQDSVRFSGLTAGTYLVTVMNSDSCVSGSVSAVLQSQPPTPIMATANVIHPNCIDSTGTITVTSPLAVGLSYSIDSINFQSGYIFSHIAPGSYSVFVKNLYSCISVPAHAVINPKPFNCSGDIFNTTATCNDFKYAVTGKLHEKLCYMVKSNKVFNVTPGMFFYYALVQAPASSFTINVVQSVNNAAFRLFSVMKDQAILWSDTCTKFIVGKETQTGQTQINVTGAVAGKFYVLSVKYDSKSIIGGVVSGTPIPEYTFFAKVNTVMVPNSSTSISMYPNNCNVVGTSNTGTASSTMMEVEVKRGQVQLYPNPGAGSYTLTVNDFGKGEAVILVMDAYGKMLFTKEVALINGSLVLPLRLQKDAANGIYFVQVTNGDQRKTIRLIKQ